VLRLTRESVVGYANDAARAVLGDELTEGAPAPALLAEAVRSAVTSGRPLRSELRVGERCFSFHFVPVGDEVNVYGQDVTARRHAEEALRAGTERFRRLVETVPDGIFIADASGRYTDVNPAGCELLGLTREEVLARTLTDVLVPEEFARLPVAIAAMHDGKVHHGEWRFRRKDGTTFIGDLDGRRLADGSFQGVLREATHRKLAEERLTADIAALTRMHALSRRGVEAAGIGPLLQETMDAAVAIMAADKGTLQLLEGETLRIVAHSGHAAPFLDFFAAAENVSSACGEATRRGERVIVPDAETSAIFAGTESLPVLRQAGVRAVQSTPLRTRAGRLLGILTTHWRGPYTPSEQALWRLDLLVRQASDLIEQKQAEEQRELAGRKLELANTELRESDRRKDEFLGMLSHELRNPLAPIRNSAYVLRMAPPGSDQARRACEVIERQTEHLTRLVDELLDVTRIARGKIELRHARVDLREVVQRAAEDHRRILEDRGVAFRTELPEAKLWADADATRITQVVGNLLHNAGKFTRHGGEVLLSLRIVERQAELRVRDTGAGIDPALLPQLFVPFVQGERTLARTEGGLGLGLALVKGLVELHGGSVGAASAGEGKGAEFMVRLPLAADGKRPSERATPEHRQPGGHRVLVVDDNADAAESLADLLRLRGHVVDVAYDGPGALAKLDADGPDTVLCDVGLPGMSGYDIARAVRARPSSAVRLVALTGYAQPEDVRRAMEAGFDAHLAKPPDPEELERVLE
jgi:PAS domain S-box-containing protein